VKWKFPSVEYSGGRLVEVHRSGWPDMFEAGGVSHLYWIESSRGQSRSWGVHRQTTDRYVCVFGTIEVACFDDRETSGSRGALELLILGPGEGLTIPPGVYHTFRPGQDVSILMNSKNPPYNAKDVDKHKLPMPNSLVSFEWPE
jgi:dTDP-4-dehydrorhamnose 3,5-epimerase-like enzyme